MQDNLKCTLDLEGSGKKLHVPCGNITRMQTNIHSYGFEGRIEFMVDGEEKVDFLYEFPIIELTLTLISDQAPKQEKPIELKAIVTQKALLREFPRPEGPDLQVLTRLFSIEFKDPALAIWSQHYPVAIFTEKSMENVINSYISKTISINIESTRVKESKPLIALGLGDHRNQVNFYSFLMWYLHDMESIWEYDYIEKKYVIRDEKKSSGKPIPLPYDTGQVTVCWPEPPRQDIRIFNSYADDPAVRKIDGKEVYEEITRDILYTTPILADVDARAAKERPKSHAFEHGLDIFFDNFPTVSPFPGGIFTFEDDHWSKDFFFKKKTYRLQSLILNVEASDFQFSKVIEKDAQVFHGTLHGSFELKEEETIRRPHFNVPLYPFPLEGKVFSEVGEEKELTFDIGKDEQTSQLYYTVQLPCAEDQKVTTPFEPTYTNGQIYNPLLKGQRVVVHFHLFTAKIVEVLDWLGCAQLPVKTQGNRTVFAPRNEDKAYTLMEHVDEEGHLVFLIERKSDKQIQLIRIKEDGLHVIVHKEGEENPQCHMWMDNEYTITITSCNSQAKETQTIKLKPEEISTLCEKGGDKSTIVQTPKSITIECDEFNLKTKKTNLTSEDATSCKGKQVNLEGSQGTQIKDGAKIDIKSAVINIG